MVLTLTRVALCYSITFTALAAHTSILITAGKITFGYALNDPIGFCKGCEAVGTLADVQRSALGFATLSSFGLQQDRR